MRRLRALRFIGGITGQFFRQFAITIAVSTLFSAFNSLTLSPALAALLLKPHGAKRDPLTWLLDTALGWFFGLFNGAFRIGTGAYVRAVGGLLRASVVSLAVYGGLLALTYFAFVRMPTGFVPQQDKGYLLVNAQLPESASVERTREVMAVIEDIAREDPSVEHTVGISGQSLLLGANAPNLGSMYVMLKEFAGRRGHSADDIAAVLREKCGSRVRDAMVSVFGAPPIDGLGATGGFKLMIEDRGNLGLAELQRIGNQIVEQGQPNAGPGRRLRQFPLRRSLAAPRHQPDQVHGPGTLVERRLQYAPGVPGIVLCEQLQRIRTLLAGERHGRRPLPPARRGRPKDPVAQSRRTDGPARYRAASPRHQWAYDADALQPLLCRGRHRQHRAGHQFRPGGGPGPRNRRQGPAPRDGPRLDRADLCATSGRQHGNGRLCPGRGFRLLAAGRPVRKLEAPAGGDPRSAHVPALLRGGRGSSAMDVNIFTQIGFVVLVGLASKNAILIVEFAKQQRDEGRTRRQATLEACRLRLRPILMTSFAFILGVVPLVLAEGAGPMRRTLGTAVFSGMLGVTFFGIFLTPVFYYVITRRGGESGG